MFHTELMATVDLSSLCMLCWPGVLIEEPGGSADDTRSSGIPSGQNLIDFIEILPKFSLRTR
jgi:hypothetical protein